MTSEALFDIGDALHPNLDHPTPLDQVLPLTSSARRQRVTALIRQSHHILKTAIEHHIQPGQRITATIVMFSGGNDSTVLAHMMRDHATHAAHANTTIGIEATRQFVRDTCRDWELPLIEITAPISYRDLVIERGFPGPAMHYKMYQRLKERCFDQIRRTLVADGRRERVVFIAGRRRSESRRRETIPLHERRGSTVWVTPLANWHKLDLNTYRLMMERHDPVPRNTVSDLLHMSGECLCGSFAKPGELDEIREWFPDVAAGIDQIQREVRAAGHKPPFDTWGHGQGAPNTAREDYLCGKCASLWDEQEDAS